ncbi:MAG TPA: tetratricopeptide repeat protein [Terriglobia bacterium]
MSPEPNQKIETDQKAAREAESRSHVERAESLVERAEKGDSPEENWLKATQQYETAESLATLRAADYRNWGAMFARLKNDPEALKRYQEAIRIDPQYAVAYIYCGNALFRLKRYEEATQNYEKATKLPNADYGTAFNGWGDTLLGLKKYEEAAEKYREAVKTNPESAAAFNGLGRVFVEKRRYSEAAGQFKRAADLKADATYFYNWGLALAKLKEYGEAAKAFRRATEIKRNYAGAYAEWGNALFETKRFAEARVNYLEAMKHDPTVVDYANWVAVLDGAKDQQVAVAEADLHIKRKPEFVDAYNYWGNALSALKRYGESIEKYRDAINLNPTSPNAYAYWGNALYDQGQYPEACSKYLEAMTYDPTAVDYSRWVLALDKLKTEERDPAIKKAEGAIARKPEYLAAYNSWGYFLSTVPKYQEALEKLDRVIKGAAPRASSSKQMESILGDAYNNWGILLLSQQDYGQAFDKFEQAIATKKDSVYPCLNWAAGLVNQKLYQEAIDKCEEAQRIDPQWTNTYLIWGNALVGLGRREEGIEKYEHSTRIDPDFAYGYHNVADARSKEGNYKLARQKWNLAREAYERAKQAFKANRDADFFWHYGAALHENLRELGKSEEVYQEGLTINPGHPGILMGLGNLKLAQRDEDSGARTGLWWEARNYYKRAEAALKARLDQSPQDIVSCLQLGQLYLQREDYDRAEKTLLQAHEQNREFAEVLNGLGVLYMKREDFAKAVRYFTDARRFDPDNLGTRSNLAEAYLKLGQNYKAMEEYKKVIQVAPDHVESLVGLGQVYTNLGEDGDEDLLQEAVNRFELAVQKSKSGEASKVFSKVELAAIYYSLGYARIQLYQASKSAGQGSFQDALRNFRDSVANDPDHQKARIAVGKLENRIKTSSPERFSEAGSFIVVVFSAFLFVFTQLAFYWKIPRGAGGMNIEAYSLMSFGSLAFMVAGFYLPKILKLKVAGVELEKSAVDQVAVSGPLKISSLSQP